MDNDFDPFDDPRMGNPWLRYATMCLNFVGAFYLLLGLVGGPGYGWVLTQQSEDSMLIGIGIGSVLFIVGISLALLNFLAAFLVGRGNKIGWVLGLIIGVLQAPNLCPPFGIIILIGLLNKKSRAVFLG